MKHCIWKIYLVLEETFRRTPILRWFLQRFIYVQVSMSLGTVKNFTLFKLSSNKPKSTALDFKTDFLGNKEDSV